MALPYARGGTREVHARYLPQVDDEGRPAGFVSVVLDVSEHKALVESLRRTVRFSEEFVGMLGHDLRNPLTAVMGAAEVMSVLNQDQRMARPIQRILSSAQRMARMIDQILDFTRARLEGGIAVHPAPIDLHAIAAQIIDEFQGAAGRQIALEVLGDARGQWDGDRLSQVLSNLVGNAIEHGSTEGPIGVHVDGRAPDRVELSVWNAGAIPAQIIPIVFEPFQGTASSGKRGLGLGLYITRQIVLAHGGTIDVRSSDAEGTTFVVSLPRTVPAGLRAPGTPVAGSQGP